MRLMEPASGSVADVLLPYTGVQRTTTPGKCWVIANMVAGLDGSASVGGRVGALSSPADVELFLRLRGLADVILVGAETVRRERYGPVRLPGDLDADRRAAGRGAPRLAVVSRSLDLDPELPLFCAADSEPPFVFTCAASDRAKLSGIRAEVIVAGDEQIDLHAVLAELAQRAMPVVLCEGGPTLLGGLIAAGLLTEYCLTLSPVVGGDALPVVNSATITELSRFRLEHVVEDDSTLFLRYLSRSHA